MAFSLIIDIPLLLGVFALIVKYKNFLTSKIIKIKLPRIVLALLAAVPLLIFEEHINCGAYGCTNVLIPPTLWFLLVMWLIFFLIVKLLGIESVIWETVFCSFLGMLFEFFIGSSHSGLRELAGANPFVFMLLMLWVGISYAFALFLPFNIIKA